MSRPAVGVVVLGMSRSGTSAVARMFVAAGFYAGREADLRGPHESNPAGHFENLAVCRVNDDLLYALDGSWLQPPADQTQIEARPWAQPRLSELIGGLLDQADGAPLAVKDPRIGMLMALWESAIGRLLHPVLVIRDPIEIALSLSRRDGTPLPFGLAAWQVHMTALLSGLDGRDVTVVRYAELLQSPELAGEIVATVASRLAEARAQRVDPAAAPTAIQPRLRRNHVRPHDHDEQLTIPQRELWRHLASLPPGGQVLGAPPGLMSVSDSVGSSLRAEQERVRQIGLLDGQQRLLAQIDSLALECSRQQERAELAELRVGLFRDSRSWKLAAPLRAYARRVRAVRAVRAVRRSGSGETATR